MRAPSDYMKEVDDISFRNILKGGRGDPDQIKREMLLLRNELSLLKRNLEKDLYHIRSVYSCRLASDVKRSVIDEIFDEQSLVREFEIETREDLKREKDLVLEQYKRSREKIQDMISRIDTSIPRKHAEEECEENPTCGRRIVKPRS
jgi:hypothetical protein